MADDYTLAADRARANRDAAQAVLAALEAGTRKQELKVAEATLEQAQATARLWKEEYARSGLRSMRPPAITIVKSCRKDSRNWLAVWP